MAIVERRLLGDERDRMVAKRDRERKRERERERERERGRERGREREKWGWKDKDLVWSLELLYGLGNRFHITSEFENWDMMK